MEIIRISGPSEVWCAVLKDGTPDLTGVFMRSLESDKLGERVESR